MSETNPTDRARDGAPLTLRQARDEGLKITVYCSGSCRKGRPLDLTKVGERVLDQPIAELVERRAFRCSSCGAREGVVVYVYRQVVGVSERVATYQQG